MAEPVYILGAARTDFRRNLAKEGKSLRDVIVEAGRAAITDAGIAPGDVQAGVVGNFAAGLFTRQLHLGSFLVEIDPAMHGLPTLHTEAACASGGVAVLTAAQQIMGGVYDVVLVVGAEQQKTMSPADGSEVLGAAADYASEKSIYGQFMFPKLFARIAQLYTEKFGLTEKQLALVAMKNHAHARRNPLAQTRDANIPLDQYCVASQNNPSIAPPLKVTDCSQITDGAAAVVLCSRRFLSRLPKRNRVQLLGWGHATDHLSLAAKDAPEFAVARKAAERAYATANVSPNDLDGVEVHDCFSITELVGYEILGLADRGGAAKLIESGATALPIVRDELGLPTPKRSCPVNAGGGLIGDGHPVGATGVRQVAEVYRHLTGSAGERQIASARRMLTFNLGGSVTTSVAMIWGAE